MGSCLTTFTLHVHPHTLSHQNITKHSILLLILFIIGCLLIVWLVWVDAQLAKVALFPIVVFNTFNRGALARREWAYTSVSVLHVVALFIG